MYFDQLLVRADRAQQETTFEQFLASPGHILEAGEEWIWLGSSSTFEHQEQAAERLNSSEAEIVQFHSDPIFLELLSVSEPGVRAALGISGLTALRKSIVETWVSTQQPACSDVAALLEIFKFSKPPHLEAVPGTSFQAFSKIPADESRVDPKLLQTLKSLSDSSLVSGRLPGCTSTEIRAGLLLIHDFLEPSHICSQSIEGEGPDVNGDYWHGIMHRREPDFGNAKYWFRRVGAHPCFAILAAAARELAQQYHETRVDEWIEKLTRSGWDSILAVDFYQAAHNSREKGSALHRFASSLQMKEMLILLTHCCRACRP